MNKTLSTHRGQVRSALCPDVETPSEDGSRGFTLRPGLTGSTTLGAGVLSTRQQWLRKGLCRDRIATSRSASIHLILWGFFSFGSFSMTGLSGVGSSKDSRCLPATQGAVWLMSGYEGFVTRASLRSGL